LSNFNLLQKFCLLAAVIFIYHDIAVVVFPRIDMFVLMLHKHLTTYSNIIYIYWWKFKVVSKGYYTTGGEKIWRQQVVCYLQNDGS